MNETIRMKPFANSVEISSIFLFHIGIVFSIIYVLLVLLYSIVKVLVVIILVILNIAVTVIIYLCIDRGK